MKWLEEYLTGLVKELEKLDYPQTLLDKLGDVKPKFSDMYVFPDLKYRDQDEGDWVNIYPDESVFESANLFEVLELEEKYITNKLARISVVCGLPVSGKTSFLKRRALKDAYGLLAKGADPAAEDPIPVFVNSSIYHAVKEQEDHSLPGEALAEAVSESIGRYLDSGVFSLAESRSLLADRRVAIYADDIDYWNADMVRSFYEWSALNSRLSLCGTVCVLNNEEYRSANVWNDFARNCPTFNDIGRYLEARGFRPEDTGIYMIREFENGFASLKISDLNETDGYVAFKREEDPLSDLLRETLVRAIGSFANILDGEICPDELLESPIDHICALLYSGALKNERVGCNIFDVYEGLIEAAKDHSSVWYRVNFDKKTRRDILYHLASAGYYDEEICFSEDPRRDFFIKTCLQSIGVLVLKETDTEYEERPEDEPVQEYERHYGDNDSFTDDYNRLYDAFHEHGFCFAPGMKEYYSALYFSLMMPEDTDLRTLDLNILPFLYSRATNFCEDIMDKVIRSDDISAEEAFKAAFKVFEFTDVPLSSRNRESFLDVSGFLIDRCIESGYLYSFDSYDDVAYQGLRLKTVVNLIEANILLGNIRKDWVDYLVSVTRSHLLHSGKLARPLGYHIEEHMRNNYPGEWSRRQSAYVHGANTVRTESLIYRFLLTQVESGRLSYDDYRGVFEEMTRFCGEYYQDYIYRNVPKTRKKLCEELLQSAKSAKNDRSFFADLLEGSGRSYDAYIHSAALIRNYDLIESDRSIAENISELIGSEDPVLIDVASELLFIQVIGARSLGEQQDPVDLASLRAVIEDRINGSEEKERTQALLMRLEKRIEMLNK